MNHAEIMRTLERLVSGLGRILGNDTEIALHDMETRELAVIINNRITGREPGYKLEDSVFDTILELSDSDGALVKYSSKNSVGQPLSSSHLVIRDDNGTAHAILCINRDVSRLVELRGYLDEQLAVIHIGDETSVDIDSPNYIRKMTQQIITDEIENAKPNSISSRQTKLNVLRKLEQKGIFNVRDAVPQVCKLLSISQATLYNYLREIRTEDAVVDSQAIELLTQK